MISLARVVSLALFAALMVSSASAIILIDDDFSQPPFVAGNLVGQGSWTQDGSASTLPLQIVGGKVVIPANQMSANNQDADHAVAIAGTAGTQTAIGVSFQVDDAPAAAVSSFFIAMEEGSASAFDNFRFAAQESSAMTYALNVRGTGQSGNPFLAGANLNYGQTYIAIGVWDFVSGNDNDAWRVYVDPTSSVEMSNTLYLSQTLTTGDPNPGFQSALISQFASATVSSSEVKIGRIVVGENFTEVFNAIPEPGTPVLFSAVGLVTLAWRGKGSWPRTRIPHRRS